MQDEIWKPVIGYEGLYEVSNLGNVQSLVSRSVNHPKDNLLKGTVNRDGYIHYGLYNKDGVRKIWKCHTLVAYAFLGERPTGYDINHIDGDKANNCAENLEYISRSENVKHAYRLGLLKPTHQVGILCSTAKLTDAQILEIRQRYANGEYQNALAIEYGVRQPAISRIVNRKRWSHI